ncbi:hypothetical protein LOTGIDRAFT_172011 [Lottia gigantea]|uniref:Uncharacterized protein n=1 Tax=Lottia gigantea TaxID=225164 RepID=V4AEL9_LOTGI|nr:hypothetical protein LOTGIDRAFT_172011 [Lottia gigantea]ESP02454.1 hypothetical protein LOTGIDRAFT_172011 [Lottia gigantea]
MNEAVSFTYSGDNSEILIPDDDDDVDVDNDNDDDTNTIFDQNWELAGASSNTEVPEDLNDCESDFSGDEMDDPKKNRTARDLTFVMPSRRYLANYVQDASCLNLEMVARHLLNKVDDVITVGLDDTTKAAGHRLFDIKTDSITITQASGEKRLLTTGYLENASHAGKAGAEAYNFKLQCLAILAGSSFQPNRFGRILEIGNEYLKHRDALNAFFEAVVDENANKLVLAVYTFISNPWFICCSEIYSFLGEILIHPLMELLGIDGRGPGKQSWTDVKIFFDQKIPHLQKLQDQFSQTVTGKGSLIGAILTEVIESLKRQLSEMDFFQIQSAKTITVNLEKLQLAPLHNLTCESRFAKLNNQVAASGGMTTVKTHSDKSIISTNGLLINEEFTSLDETEKRLRWKWGRTSQPVQDVKQLEKDFLATVKMAKRLALLKKEELKRKRNEKMLKVLESCKTHIGSVTPTTINLLDRLTESQLITEICYIRLTICPDIHQKRRIKLPNGHFKFQTFSKAELKQTIITVIKPGNNVVENIDEIVKDALKSH